MMSEDKKAKPVSTVYEGAIVPQTIKIGLPILLGNLLYLFYVLIDTYFVSLIDQHSTALINGITLIAPISLIIQAIAMGLNIGVTAHVAHDFGKNKDADLSAVFNSGLVLGGTISILFVVSSYVFIDPIINLLAGSEMTVQDKEAGKAFLSMLLPGMFLQPIGSVFFGSLRGIGKTVPIFVTLLLTAVINTALDPLLIFQFHMGIGGAGLATSISFILSAVIISAYIVINKTFTVSFRFSLARIKTMLEIGKMGSAQALTILSSSAGILLLNNLVSSVGSAQMNSWGLCSRIDQLVFIPIMGIAGANVTIIGQNLGRGNLKRVNRAFLTNTGFAIATTLVLITLYVLNAHSIFGLFSKVPEVIQGAVNQVSIVNFAFLALALEIMVTNTFQGLKKALPVFALTAVRFFLLAVPLSYWTVGVLHWGMLGIFVSLVTAHILTALVAFVWLWATLKKIPATVPTEPQGAEA